MNLLEIQSALRAEQVDGWLFYDHHERDPLAYRVLGFKPPRMVTRRWYYFIPATGEPRKLVHAIESGMLDALPGSKSTYSSWSKQAQALEALLQGCKRVAMQYSPKNNIPYIGLVDAGTIELIRSLGADIASSANLVQFFEARWTEAQLETHLEAGRRVDRVCAAAFAFAGEKLNAGMAVDEFSVMQFILESFAREGLFTDHGPIVAVNANASNPHYEPTAEDHAPIVKGDFLLIDLWAKLANDADSVYYDITWTGSTARVIPGEQVRIFEAVSGARDAAIRRVQTAIEAGQPIHGFEVDDATRGHLRALELDQYFIHRTGHSIGRDVHGAGANMDNLETHDDRRLIPGTCFSIEPGVYLPEFGVRSEVNMYVGADRAIVTGAIQKELVRICG
ncbi:MAG TPA: M24 family metallopeptidase [Bryobacteraceae bacterium]|nr:M24 family metallopeptidase [Bryobacteraceae bacterium]